MKCQFCDKELIVKPSNLSYKEWAKRRFCSKNCYSKYQVGRSHNGSFRKGHRVNVGRIHLNRKSGYIIKERIKKICPICKKEFLVIPSRIRKKYCSYQCFIKIKPSNWALLYTSVINEKRKIARLKQKLPTIDTSIERKTKEWLDRKGINYIHPFNLGDKFQCDFYIPALNLIVECDGTYWHSREDMKKRDKAKDAYAKKCGFNILRLKEEEINNNLYEGILSKVRSKNKERSFTPPNNLR